MLSEKPWKSEAILRLVVSIIICAFLGSVVMAALGFRDGIRPINEWVFAALVVGSMASCGVALLILRKAWDRDRFTRPFVLMVFFLYLGLTLGAFVQHFAGKSAGDNPTLRTVVAAVSLQGSAVALIWCFVREHTTSWRMAFGFPKRWKTALLHGAVVTCAFLPVGWLLQTASIKLMIALHMKPEMQQAVQALTQSVTWVDRLVLGIVTIGLAPLGEELIFRGVLYPAVKRAGYPRLALWSTSLLFAAIHQNLMTFVPLLILALLLVWLYEETDNLLAPIAAHAAFNGIQFAGFYLLPVAAEKFEWLRRLGGNG